MNIIPIDWSLIKTVFLDLDGTLLDLHFDNHFWLQHMPKRYAEIHNIPHDKAKEFMSQHSDSTYGSLNWYCLDHWSTTLNLDIVDLKHEVADRIAIRENVIPFLIHLKQLQKRIILLTNAHRKSLTVKFQYVEIEGYFDEIITSHDIGLAKEEPGFWEMLLSHETYDKTQSLFIDDNLDVLNNANNYGIKFLYTISRPDSQKPIKNNTNYTAIDNYQQLMS